MTRKILRPMLRRKPKGGYPRHQKIWTKEDDLTLSWFFGSSSMDILVRKLGRTPSSIRERAKKMGIRAGQRRLSLGEISRRTGYDTKTIVKAAARYGMTLRRDIAYTGNRTTATAYAVSEDAYDELVSALIDDPPERWARRRGGWGFRGVPDTCRDCGMAGRPHVGRGLCRTCHRRHCRMGTLGGYPVIRRPYRLKKKRPDCHHPQR